MNNTSSSDTENSAPETESADKKEEPKSGVLHTLREKSLKAAGAGFLFADSSLILSGLLAKQYNVLAAGSFGITAGIVGTRYGNAKAEKQLEQLNRRLGAYLRKQGVEIPEGAGPETLTKQGGIIDNIEAFLYANPSQVMNILYSLIGLQFATQARKIGSKSLFASGCLLITGALSGILLPEKKPDPEHPPQGALQKAVSFIEEKPLRLTSTLFNLNQVFLALNALEDRRNHPGEHGYVFKLMAVAGFTFGNTMLALSSKSHGGAKGLDTASMGTLAETSARIIAAQKPEMQKALLDQVAGFLASQPNIHMKADELSTLLQEKVTQVAQKPLDTSTWQGRVEGTAGEQHTSR